MSDDIKIEHNIPIPIGRTRADNNAYNKLKVGDSFVTDRSGYYRFWAWARRHKPNWRMTQRSTPNKETGKASHRIWRIK
jgi:hypothetical protein